MSDVALDQEHAIAQAKEEGFKVYRGGRRRLLLDLDSEDDLFRYEQRLPKLQEILWPVSQNEDALQHDWNVEVTEKKRWRSKSHTGWHVLLTLSRPLPLRERLLLQAILSSDPIRELYSLLRFWEGTKEPSLLFRPQKNKVTKMTPKQPKDDWADRGVTDDDVPF